MGLNRRLMKNNPKTKMGAEEVSSKGGKQMTKPQGRTLQSKGKGTYQKQ